MNIEEFEKTESLKAYFRKQLIDELVVEIAKLKWSEDNTARNGSPCECTYRAEDSGFNHAKAKLLSILKSR